MFHSNIIKCNDNSGVVNLLDSIKDMSIYNRWVYLGIYFWDRFWVCTWWCISFFNSSSGQMGDVSVSNQTFSCAIFDAIVVDLKLGRFLCTYINHITWFYLRENSFWAIFLKFHVQYMHISLFTLSYFLLELILYLPRFNLRRQLKWYLHWIHTNP